MSAGAVFVNDTLTPHMGASKGVLDGNGNGTFDPEEQVSLAAIICLPIFILTGIVGNTLVCISVVKIHKLRTVANSFVVSLAISDLAVCIIVLPLGLYEAVNFGTWNLGDAICNTWLTLDLILSTASVWNLCAIAGDRWLAITKPVWYANRRSATLAGIAIAVAWGVAFVITIPSTVMLTLYEREATTCYLSVNLNYIVFGTIVAFFVPCVIVLAVYVRIFIAARDHFRRKPSALGKLRKKSTTTTGTDRSQDSMADSSGNTNAVNNGKTEYTTGSSGNVNSVSYSAVRKISTSASMDNSIDMVEARPVKRRTSRIPRISVTREKKAAIVLSIVVGAFIVCWLPYFTAVLVYAASGGMLFAGDNVFVAFSWLGWLNSIVNPIIYTIFNRDFRKAFKRILTCNNWFSDRWNSTTNKPTTKA